MTLANNTELVCFNMIHVAEYLSPSLCSTFIAQTYRPYTHTPVRSRYYNQ